MGGGHPGVLAAGSGGLGGQGGSGRTGGAVAYYKFDEGYSTTAHNSGSQGETLQGTLTNMATSPSTTTSGWTQAGKFGKGLVFDGSNDVVTLTDNDLLDFTLTDSFALSFWVKSNDSGTITNLMAKYPGTNTYYTIEFRNSGKAYFEITDGNNFPNITSTTTINDNNWH